MHDSSKLSPLDTAALQLRPLGVTIAAVPGGFVVNYKGGVAATAYQTDDVNDALRHGLRLPKASEQEPPLGPMGRRMTRRAKMYAHNRKLAAKRLAAQTLAVSSVYSENQEIFFTDDKP